MENFIDDYFATARERYQILQRRKKGMEWPWTDDKIFQEWSFCNVHREEDRTTIWFRENIRDPLRNDAVQVAKATLIFRWFNRIETAIHIKDLILGDWDTEEARRRLQGVKPVVTGAYMVLGQVGYSKLDGVLAAIDDALPILEQIVPSWGESLQLAHIDICQIPYVGPFVGYEIISDLRWCEVLAQADDIMTWANPGPGCKRGLRRVLFGEKWREGELPKLAMQDLMQDLLRMSKDPNVWPFEWRTWEMREVEHWACEFHKYQKAAEGNRLKRRYHHVSS